MHWNYVAIDARPKPLPVCVGSLLVGIVLIDLGGRHGTQTFELPRRVADKLCGKCCTRILRGDVPQHSVLVMDELMSHICGL